MRPACQDHSDALLWLIDHNITLPSLPGVAKELLAVTRESVDTIPISKVAQSVEKDPSLAARLLRVANSPYFGVPREVSNVHQALTLIGLDEALSIIHFYLLTHAFPQDSTHDEQAILRLWLHNWACATVAQMLGQPKFLVQSKPSDLYLAGLMHDVGRVLLAVSLPKMLDACFGLAQAEKIPLREAERRILGIDHSVLGGYMIEKWNLPKSLQEAAAYHHWPEEASERSVEVAAVVQLADMIAHRSAIGGNGAPVVEDLSASWLVQNRLGSLDHEHLLDEATKRIGEVLQKRAMLFGATEGADPDAQDEDKAEAGDSRPRNEEYSRSDREPVAPPSRWQRLVRALQSFFGSPSA